MDKTLATYQIEKRVGGEMVLSRYREIDEEIKRLKAEQDAIKAKLVEAMEAQGVRKIENDFVSAAYIAETDRETFDSKAFRVAHPDLYDEYVRFSKVRASVRITVKNGHET